MAHRATFAVATSSIALLARAAMVRRAACRHGQPTAIGPSGRHVTRLLTTRSSSGNASVVVRQLCLTSTSRRATPGKAPTSQPALVASRLSGHQAPNGQGRPQMKMRCTTSGRQTSETLSAVAQGLCSPLHSFFQSRRCAWDPCATNRPQSQIDH